MHGVRQQLGKHRHEQAHKPVNKQALGQPDRQAGKQADMQTIRQ